MAGSVAASRVLSMYLRAEQALEADYDAYLPPAPADDAPPHSHHRRADRMRPPAPSR